MSEETEDGPPVPCGAWLVNSKTNRVAGPFTTRADAIHAQSIATDRDDWQIRPRRFAPDAIREMFAAGSNEGEQNPWD